MDESKDYMITTWANQRLFEDIIANIARDEDGEDLEDLSLDLYISLMDKPTAMLASLSANSQINYYATRMVINNLESKNSPYYYRYKKDKTKRIPIERIDITDNEDYL